MKQKYFGCSDDIVAKIKKIVSKKWEEKAKAENKLSHEKMYKRMVEEAVILIKARWERNATYGTKADYPVDVLEVESFDSFFITKEKKLYSQYGHWVYNPKTGHCCFFDTFTFENEDEKEKYIKDILAQLPEGTIYDMKETKDAVCGVCQNYTFKLKISME